VKRAMKPEGLESRERDGEPAGVAGDPLAACSPSLDSSFSRTDTTVISCMMMVALMYGLSPRPTMVNLASRCTEEVEQTEQGVLAEEVGKRCRLAPGSRSTPGSGRRAAEAR